MIGDDLQGDVIGAIDAGLQGCLVQTGKFKEPDRYELPQQALVIKSVANLLQNI